MLNLILCICIQVVFYFILVPIMSEPTLYDIPLEVFRDFFLPDLGAKEVASLSLVSRDLRDLCDDNEIWKILYSRTTKRVMITDKSVHRLFLCSAELSDPVLCVGFGPGDWCWPKELDYFPSCNAWWRMDGRTLPTDAHYHEIWHAGKVLQHHHIEYLQALREYWATHNASKGLSTVNLCQCTSHYEESTLGFAEVKTKRKCYKKIVLKKWKTEKLRRLKSVEKKKEKKVHQVSEVRKSLEKLEAKLRELDLTEEGLVNATTHLQEATDAL